MIVKEKLESIRNAMQAKGISAYIIPSQDPHMSEYVADRWQARAWISGFDGSAGTVVITMNKAKVWTDYRYYLQASEQIKGTEFELMKLGMPDTPSLNEWLKTELNEADEVGYDGKVFPRSEVENMSNFLTDYGIKLNGDYDLISEIWSDIPELPKNDIFVHEVKYAGKSRLEKLSQIREKMNGKGVDYHVVTTLDDIAWIFNLRGSDVNFNPVFYAYALIGHDDAELFINKNKVPGDVQKELESHSVKISDYDEIFDKVSMLPDCTKLLLDTKKVNNKLYTSINKNVKIINGSTISTGLKACKNIREIEGMNNAMQRDGAAMVRFIKWLEESVGKTEISELDAAAKLRDFRKENDLFVGESFNSISGYKGHGAIVHYAASEEAQYKLEADGFYLIDSGGQYYDGTTDITRTIYLGKEPTEQEKIDYTLVLKGHIQLSMQKFPQNTRGSQLDVLARQYMWNLGINYGHGTGHGVGCFLNVHEGPQSIRMDENPATLELGMILSNEPGIYRADKYGIRIENLILITKNQETEFGNFYQFENLTVCPIDTKPIAVEMLTKDERNWFNDYHKTVYEIISPLLSEEENSWLKEKTRAI